MHRRNILAALGLALLAVWLVSPASGAEPRVFTDAAGRQVELPETIGRVLAAGPPASVLLYALAPEKMVGWVREPTPEEKAFIAAPYRDLPTHGRLTGKGNTANLEMVLEMKPDIILDVGTVDPTYASLADRVQEQTGIPYVLIDGGFARTPDTLREVGALLGTTERAEELARYSEASLARLRAAVADIPAAERPRVYYGRGPEGLETGLAGSINMEVLAAVGAVNVAEAAGGGGLANVSIEQVLGWNPEVILAQEAAFQAAVGQNPLWSEVAAVRDGRVYRAPALPFGWFDAPPGINRVIGVAWLTNVLYPGKSEIDLRAETGEFYRLFYHIDLGEAQLDTLLDGSTPPS